MNNKVESREYTKVLDKLAESLDVSPSDFLKMRDRYTSVSGYLERQECEYPFEAYPHGSFALGTVTRPYLKDEEADFDVDIVNEYKASYNDISAEELKGLTGEWLKSNGKYEPLLDEEGKRCWTLEYAEKSPGFHIDILPVCLDSSEARKRLILDDINPEIANTALKLTHRENSSYQYLNTNPRGYQRWFADRQSSVRGAISIIQKQRIFSEDASLINEYNFSSYDEIPDELVRTPLQRVVQILKRHRDVRFSGSDISDHRPISVVITTICGLLYQGETNTYEALKNIVGKIDVYSPLLEGKHIFADSLNDLNVIKRTHDGKWVFSNPVEPQENFAEKWHENDNANAKAFFAWVQWVRQDFLEGDESENLRKIFGDRKYQSAISGTSFLSLDELDKKRFPKVNVQNKLINKPYGR